MLACKDEQRERYLVPAAREEKYDALAMTEPEAAFDVRGMKTFASSRRRTRDFCAAGNRFGSVADAASIKLPKRLPYHVAMDLLLTGRWIDAAEARQWGFVNRIVAAHKRSDEAWKMARLLESGPPLVFAAIKEIVREAEDQKFQPMLERVTKRELRTVDALYGSEDMREGFQAFAEKRNPVWKGR